MLGFNNLSDFWFGSGRGAAGRGLAGGEQYRYMGEDPHADQQNALIQMLMQQAQGQGPSVAQQEYRNANQDAMHNQMAMSRGRGAGAMRNAGMEMGQINGGLANGLALARTREMMAAQQGLQSSLTAAGQMDFQRASANQQMYANALQSMMTQGGIGQSLAGLAGQGIGAYAMLRGPKMGGGPARQPFMGGQGQNYGSPGYGAPAGYNPAEAFWNAGPNTSGGTGY